MPQQDSTLQEQRTRKGFFNINAMRKGKGKKADKARQVDPREYSTPEGTTEPLISSDTEAFSTPQVTPHMMELAPQTDAVPMKMEPVPQTDAVPQAAGTSQKVAVPQTDVVTSEVQHAPVASSSDVLLSNGITEKVKVYYCHAQNGILQIVGGVGERIVFIRTKVMEVVGVPVEKLREAAFAAAGQAKSAVNSKTVWLQDGYIYIMTKVEGQVVYIKAKVSESVDVVKAKAGEAGHMVVDYKAACVSRAAPILESSKARANLALQPFKPYYVKVHNGVANVLATVGDRVVVIQAKISDVYTSIQVWTVESATRARAAIDHFSSPLVSRVISLRNTVAGRVEDLTVSVKAGVVYVKGTLGKHIVHLQAKISDVVSAIQVKTSDGIVGTKKAISDFTAKLVTVVSRAYGQAFDGVSLLYTKTKDGVVHIACQVNDRILVLRIKVTELVELLRSKSVELCATSRAAIIDTYGDAKMRVLRVSEILKAKSLELGASARSLAGDQKARVTVVSATGGAVALGASGGATGLLAGGGVGAGCGLILAPFTLGLSIPVGAAMGAGTGLCLGTAAGGTAGLVTGGAAGYGAHKHKDAIGQGVNGACTKVRAYKAIAAASTNKLCAQVMGHTGGTAFA